MLTQRILAGLILAGIAGAVVASEADAQSGKLSLCKQECAGNLNCIRSCGSTEVKRHRVALKPPPRREPPPTVLKSWHDEVFAAGKDGGGGGGGGR
jgi:hypothetical protein